MICFEISRSRSNLVTVLTLKFHVTNHALTINLDQSDEAAHWCLNTQTQEKVCVWCVFHIFYGLDGTLCLQPMAGQSVWSECERSRAKVLAKRITLKLLITWLVIKALRAATSLKVIG